MCETSFKNIKWQTAHNPGKHNKRPTTANGIHGAARESTLSQNCSSSRTHTQINAEHVLREEGTEKEAQGKHTTCSTNVLHNEDEAVILQPAGKLRQ